jgi:hypothetical protein
VVTWIVVAVCVVALLILGLAVQPVLGRLGALREAAVGLLERQHDVLALQARAETLTATVQALQERAELAGEQVAVLKAARGRHEQVPGFITGR